MFVHCLNVKQFYLTLSGATTLGQSGPWTDDNEGVLNILQSPRTGASQLDGLMSNPSHTLETESYPSAKMQLVYSTTTPDWASNTIVRPNK